MKKKKSICIALLLSICLGACGTKTEGDTENMNNRVITAKEAYEEMQEDDSIVIVDVRREDEYETGHVPGAILIPNETIGTEEPELLPDKDARIFIYCRSGNRSAQAAKKLAALGYTDITDFGGIMDWPYETEK